jgi:crossover junction endodeoxyribonuclease RusA
MVELRIRGLPAPQGSKKHIGRGIMVESSTKVKPWRQDIVGQSWDQYKGEPMTGPLEMEIIFWFPRPQTHYRVIGGQLSNVIKDNKPTHTTSCSDGDLDKVVRSTLDGLSAKAGGCVIQDDSLVVKLSCEKRYVTGTEGCGAYIRVIESQYDSKRSGADIRANAQALVCQ